MSEHVFMILYLDVPVKEIFKKEKGFKWPKPERCPKCGSGRLWGHGYVARYFEGFEQGLWMKRWRCPDCSAVHTARPKECWRRFRHSIRTILKSLRTKLLSGRWLKSLRRQVQQYWFRGLRKQCVQEGRTWQRLKPETLERLIQAGIIVSTHSLTYFRI